MRRIIGIMAVLAVPVLAADADDAASKELKVLQGTWKTVAVEAAGKPLPKDGLPAFTMIIAAGGKSTGRMPKNEFQFTITIDPEKSPKTIENLHLSGDQKGKKQYGIYKLEGDTFTVCMSRAGAAEGDRPKEFSTKDSTCVVFVFERIKEGKKR